MLTFCVLRKINDEIPLIYQCGAGNNIKNIFRGYFKGTKINHWVLQKSICIQPLFYGNCKIYFTKGFLGKANFSSSWKKWL